MLDIVVKPCHLLTQVEDERLAEICRLAYAHETGPGPAFDLWAASEFSILGLLDKQIVSLVELLVREIRVGGKSVPVGGLGGVATHPDYQRRGYAGLLMIRAREWMQNELRVPFGMLVCSPHREAFYQSLGWQTITEPMLVETSTGKRVWPERMMILSLSGQDWPAGPVDTCGSPW